jgi:hypothetical protein
MKKLEAGKLRCIAQEGGNQNGFFEAVMAWLLWFEKESEDDM